MIKRLLFASVLALGQAISAPASHAATAETTAVNQAEDNSDSVAVIIGNQDYEGELPDVRFAENDADAMKRYLVDVLGYREGNIINLRNASTAEMMEVFGNAYTHEGKLWRWIKPGKSRVTVYYSGHGVPGLKDKRGYLLPVNANPEAPEISAYPLDQLYDNLRKLDTQGITVYLDACFSGRSGGGVLVNNTSGLSVVVKEPHKRANGIVVLTAAQNDQVASWDTNASHGLFTLHLLKGLYGKADKDKYGNQDGKVSASEIKAYLDDHMTYAARRYYGRTQTVSLDGPAERIIGKVYKDGNWQPVGGSTHMASLPRSESRPRVEQRPRVESRQQDYEEVFVPVIELEERMRAKSTVNIRIEPTVNSRKAGLLPRGRIIQVTGITEDDRWYQVEHNGRIGYVYAALLEPTGDWRIDLPPAGSGSIFQPTTRTNRTFPMPERYGSNPPPRNDRPPPPGARQFQRPPPPPGLRRPPPPRDGFSDAQPLERDLERAERLALSGNVPGAMRATVKLRDTHGESPLILDSQWTIAEQWINAAPATSKGDLLERRKRLRQLMKWMGEKPELELELAETNHTLKDYKKAEKLYTAWLKNVPRDHPDRPYVIGMLQAASKKQPQ